MTSGEDAAERRARLSRLLLIERGIPTDDGVVRVSRDGVLRASFVQERMWFWDRVTAPRSFLHNVPLTARLRGALDAGALQAAVNAVVARHESLRTSFSLSGAVVVQHIHDDLEIPLVQQDLSAESDPWLTVDRLGYTEARATFDLTRVPLLRATLLRVAEDDHVLLITAHHMVWDGWSTGLLVHELATHYRAARNRVPADMPPLPVQYLDWAVWQRRHLAGETLQGHLNYWHRELTDARTVHLPPVITDTSGLTSDRGKYVTFTVTPALTAALSDLGRREGATLSMVLLAGFTALMHRLTGEADLTIGGLIANRTRPEVEGLIGFFVNTLPLRSRTSPGVTFRQHLQRIRMTALGAYEHQGVPLGRIARHAARTREGVFDEPLYTVDFQLQTSPRAQSDFGELKIEILDRNTRTADFDLGVILWQRLPDLTEHDGLQGWVEYRTDLFDEPAVQRLVERYLSALEAVVHSPSIRLTDLPVVSPDERASSVVRGPEAHVPLEGVPVAIQQLAKTAPASVAVSDGDGSVLTYAALAAAVTAAGRQLADLDVGPEAVVAIVGSWSRAQLSAVCAVMSRGAAFLLVDPELPHVSPGDVLARSRPAVAFVDPELDVPLPVDTHRLPLTGAATVDGPLDEPCPLLAQGLAQVIFTPGPEGRGTGVMIHHAALMDRVHGFARTLRLQAGDILAHTAPQVSGASISRLLAPLACGAHLRLVPYRVARNPHALASLLATEEVTVAHLAPRALIPLVDICEGECLSLPALRCVVVGGEALPPSLVRRWRTALPGTRLMHALVVPECSGDVTRCEEHADAWPEPGTEAIGRPAANTSLYLVDPQRSPVATGARGDLCVGGVGLGRGYLGEPRRTAERFVPDPFSTVPGSRMYRVGTSAFRREGGRIRLRQTGGSATVHGERVCLEEIDAALAADPGVREAAAVVRPDPEAGARVVGYVVPSTRPSGAADGEHVRSWRDVYGEIYSRPPAAGLEPDLPDLLEWTSSLDGAPISRQQMNERVRATVEHLNGFRARRILEIGCGTGTLLRRLAGGCAEYAARDLSPLAIDRLRAALANRPICGVTLGTAEAADFSGVALGRYDLVVVNSVVHCFPSAAYLELVVRGAVERVRTGGSVYLGDLRSLPLLRTSHSAVELTRAHPDTSASELRARVERAVRCETELAVDPRLFAVLRQAIPRIAAVEVLPRPGRYRNDMAQFRFDAVLHLDSPPPSPSPAADVAWADGAGLSSVRRILTAQGPPSLAIRGVPDKRCAAALAVERALDEPLPGATTGGLRRATGSSAAGVVPDDLAALAGRYGYTMAPSLDLSRPGHFDALLCRGGGPGRLPALLPDGHDPAGRPEELTNTPTSVGHAAHVVAGLRRGLPQRLSPASVPSAFVVLDTLPRLPDGNVNRAGLPPPVAAPTGGGRGPRPRNDVERRVADVWSDVLGICEIGVGDRLFEDVEGDALLAAVLAGRLREEFRIELSLHDLLREPTVAAAARRVGAGHEEMST